MEITYLGHSCFKLKNKSSTVIIDPYDQNTGLNLGRQTADIVLISHQHPDHNASDRIGVDSSADEKPMVIDVPGEYEIKGTSIFGVESFHDDKDGVLRGANIIFTVLIDGLSICHLGDLCHQLTDEQVARIGEVDVLICPVGGQYTLDAKGAIAVMNRLEPKIFVPMHYRTPLHNLDQFSEIATLETFNNEYGIAPTPIQKLELTKEKLPEETEIVVFDKS